MGAAGRLVFATKSLQSRALAFARALASIARFEAGAFSGEGAMRAFVLAVCVAAVAACNPSAPGGDAGSGSTGPVSNIFPNLTGASYRSEGTILNPESGQAMPIVIIRDGPKARMEMTSARGEVTIISNPDTGDVYSIVNAGGRNMALRADASAMPDPNAEWAGDTASGATFSGPCAGAGQVGAEWARTTDGHADTVCVTQDGIILKATRDGVTTWDTTSVERGPQSADLFTLPAGVQVMDLGNIGGRGN